MYRSGSTAFATSECLPSAPTTTFARSVTVVAALGVAADARHPPVLDQDLLDREGLAHLRARRGGGLDQQRVEHDPPGAVRPVGAPFAGRGVPATVTGPKSNEYLVIGGQLVASSWSRMPQRASAATAGGCARWVDIVSLGNVALSTSSTR